VTGRPRQRDIAKLAGVSQTAVSLVLNGRTAEHGINRATEQRILAAIRELGYVPDVTAQALRRGRNGLIGVHTYEPLFPTSKDSYYDEFMVGIEQQATRSGQDLVLFTSVHQTAGDQSVYRGGQNRLRLADGAVILGFQQRDDELERLAAEGFVFVYIGRREKAASLMPYVTADYRAAVTDVIDRAHRLGHRRVAYLGMPDQAEPRTERREAFHESCAANGIAIADETFTGGGRLDRAWLDRVTGGGATLLLTERTAHLDAVAAVCDEAQVLIPQALSVIGLDATDYRPQASSREWTHITVPRRAIGVRAVELLLEVLDGAHPLSYHELLPCGFEPGATLAARR